MSRDFAPVSPSIWSSPAFLSLDSDARQLVLYFISGPHANSAGCSRVREGYALSDLQWAPPQYRAALASIVAADMVLHDPATSETYVKKWFTHKGNIPTNKDHAKGCEKIISKIDSDEIRELAEADFLEAVMATAWGPKIYGPQPTKEPHPFDVVPGGLTVSPFLANSPLVKGRK